MRNIGNEEARKYKEGRGAGTGGIQERG